jgi:hypothetical protein
MKMRRIARITSAMTAAAIASLVAGPAEAALECMQCRAVAAFITCAKPLDGLAAFQARVIKVEKSTCSQILSLDVPRASKLSLPSPLRVDLGSCAYWAGKPDDVIAMAVWPHASDQNVYSMACRLF